MKTYVHLLASLVLVLFFSGCNQSHEKTLKVGMCQWPGYEPLFLAAQLGFYDQSIKILRFSSPPKAYQAFRSGAIDVVGLTADEIFKHSSDNGNRTKIFLILDISNGADAILAQPYVSGINDIKGRNFAVESSVLGQYMLQRILDTAKVDPNDIRVTNIEIVDQPKAYKEKKADVFVTFEPSKTLIMQQGGHVIFDSTMIPNEIVDALAAKETTIKHSKKAIASLKRGWYKALDYIQQHPDAAYAKMGKLENISAEEFKKSLEGIKLGTKALNTQMIQHEGLIKPLEQLQTMMIEKGIIRNRRDPHLILEN